MPTTSRRNASSRLPTGWSAYNVALIAAGPQRLSNKCWRSLLLINGRILLRENVVLTGNETADIRILTHCLAIVWEGGTYYQAQPRQYCVTRHAERRPWI